MTSVRSISSRPVPVIDLGLFEKGEDKQVAAIVRQWQVAMETGGYACVINHGVPDDLVHGMEEQSRTFHQLNSRDKLSIKINRDQRGYLPAQLDSVAGMHKDITISEALVIATEHDKTDKNVVMGKRFYGSNKWPETQPSLRPVAEAYLQTMVELGKRLLPLWARALGKSPAFFDEKFEGDYSYLRMVRYPGRPQGKVQASNAHVDAGFMTLMPKSNLPGLQIQHGDGEWFYPEYPDSGILVFVGAFLEHWTGKGFRAAPHRVFAYPHASRYSLPCFINPSFETTATGLVDMKDADNSDIDTVSFWEFFSAYMDRTYQHYNV